MQIYRWFVIALLFLLAVSGALIASLIGCIDRNPVVSTVDGQVLNQVPISWVILGLAALIVIGSVIVVIMSVVRKGYQVFGRLTTVLAAIMWGIAVGMVVSYWPWVNKPLNEQQTGERLEASAVWFYFIGGVLIFILAMVAMMRVVAISIQDAGCEPAKIDIPEGMYKCKAAIPEAKGADRRGADRRGAGGYGGGRAVKYGLGLGFR